MKFLSSSIFLKSEEDKKLPKTNKTTIFYWNFNFILFHSDEYVNKLISFKRGVHVRFTGGSFDDHKSISYLKIWCEFTLWLWKRSFWPSNKKINLKLIGIQAPDKFFSNLNFYTLCSWLQKRFHSNFQLKILIEMCKKIHNILDLIFLHYLSSFRCSSHVPENWVF